VRAKTGTLTAVRTLSGFTATPDGRRVVFSVLLAGVRDMTAAQRQLDSAVARLARFTG
jgi:D-alanyl-D-alanine carboxypeptidase